MTVSDEFQDYVLEQLADIGAIIPKKMFGGVGLYYRKLFFGILYHNKIITSFKLFYLYLHIGDPLR